MTHRAAGDKPHIHWYKNRWCVQVFKGSNLGADLDARLFAARLNLKGANNHVNHCINNPA